MQTKEARIAGIISRTEDILEFSSVDLRASDIGETDSSKISCAFSPGPVVSARSPIIA